MITSNTTAIDTMFALYLSLHGLIASAIAVAVVGFVAGRAAGAIAVVVYLAIIGLSAKRLWLDNTGGTSFRGSVACAVFIPPDNTGDAGVPPAVSLAQIV